MITMDPNVTLAISGVLVALIGIIVPMTTLLIKYVQDRRIAEAARARAAGVDEKLDGIHRLVNSQLSDAVNRFNEALIVIDELKQMLILLAPDDPRVQAIAGRNSLATLSAAAE